MYDLNDLTTTKEFAYQFCEKYNMEHTKNDMPAGEVFGSMSEYDISVVHLNNYVTFKDCHDEPIEDVHDLGEVVTFKHDGIGYF